MSQTPPAPFAGIPGVPAAVVVGVVTTIALPVLPAGPQPYVYPWVVLLNASPYTIVVKTGATTTQIAAFNSDKVYIYPGGGPHLTFVAVAGFGTPNPGSDSTVYSTFYHDEPPGQYPAYIGPGGALSTQTSIIPAGTFGLAGPANTTFPSSGANFSAQGYAAVSIFLSETSGLTPLQLTIVWTDTTGNQLGQRIVVCPAGGNAAFTVPHIGPAFFIVVRNGTATASTFTLAVFQLTFPQATWTLPDNNILIPFGSVSVPATSGLTIGASVNTYAGPVILSVLPVATTWQLQVQYQLQDASWTLLYVVSNGGEILAPGGSLSLLVPPNPLRLLFSNADGSARVPVCEMVADDWRISA